MKRFGIMMIALGMLFQCTACGAFGTQAAEPQLEEAQSICELATLECYYHNVAKYEEEKAKQFLFWTKGKNFWLEYNGTVTLGVDASQIAMTVENEKVSITIPQAEVQGTDVDRDSMSYIVNQSSAAIKVEDETEALSEAQKDMEETAANDTTLMNQAQERAKLLLEEYVNNIGEATGVDYEIEWVELEESVSAADSSAS